MQVGPLVGREQALAELAAVLDEAVASRGRLVLVTGEAGIGKTRLAEELVRRADGFAHHWAWCRNDQTMGSLRTWASVLRAFTATTPAVSELAERSPVLGALVAGRGAGGVHPEAARGALAEDVVEALRRAGPTPWLVVLDDAHEAEASTLRLLLDVSDALRSLPVVVVATARDTGWTGREELRAELLRQGRRVPLEPLSPDEVRQLVPGADERLLARTGGNPLLVTELARDPAGVPVTLRSLVGSRLGALPPETRTVVAAAAVLGPRFRLDVLAEVTGTPLADVAAHLVDDLLVPSSAGEGRFTHELLRDATYEEIPPHERQEWHARAGEVLDAFRVRGRMVASAEVAGHLIEAGRGHEEDAVARCLDAAADAEAVQAFEDSRHWYARALDLLDEPAARAEVLVRRAQSSRAAGDATAAREDLLTAGSLAQQADRADLVAHAALALGSGPGGFEVDQQDPAQLDLLERALELVPESDLALRAALLARRSVARAFLDPEDVLVAQAQKAVQLARESGDPLALAGCLAALCDALGGPDHVDERLRNADEVVELARSQHHADLELLGRRLRVVALMELGRRQEVEREITAYELKADQLRHPLYQWYPPLWRSAWATAEGRYDDAAALLDQVREIGRGSSNADLLAYVGEMCTAAWRPDPEGLSRMRQQLAGFGFTALWVQVTQAFLAALLGELDDARRLFDAVAPRLGELPRDAELLCALAQAAEVVERLGGHPHAADLYAMLEPYAELWAVEGIGAGLHGPVHASLARCAPDPAVRAEHRARAEELLRSAGAVGRVARLPAAEATAAQVAAVGAEHPSAVHEGAVWAFRWQGTESRVRDSKGLRDLAVLLARPGTEVPALDLYGGPTEHDTGEVLDATAREAYKRRLRELEEADSLSETEATERDLLLEQLAGAYGLGGRVRRTGSSSEKARSAVTARLRDALKRIAAADPALGRHLERSVRTGTFCCYEPETPVAWRLTP